MSEAARLVTAEELAKFPDDGYRYELVKGRVVRMSPVSISHGRIVAQVALLLGGHLKQRNLGVLSIDLGCKLESNPDTVRGPDIAFIRQERIPSPEPKGFWNGVPDVAVEVPATLTGDDILDLSDVIAGFHCPAREIFE
jgi:Uma2 family endonuclease